jgi:hypothetical protein
MGTGLGRDVDRRGRRSECAHGGDGFDVALPTTMACRKELGKTLMLEVVLRKLVGAC